jgi:hypothetical protein
VKKKKKAPEARHARFARKEFHCALGFSSRLRVNPVAARQCG